MEDVAKLAAKALAEGKGETRPEKSKIFRVRFRPDGWNSSKELSTADVSGRARPEEPLTRWLGLRVRPPPKIRENGTFFSHSGT